MPRTAACARPAADGPAVLPADAPSTATGWVLAHCSDVHLARPEALRLRDFLGKRLVGWLGWQLKRRHSQDEGLLTTIAADLQRARPDHVVVTGDLAHLGLAEECAAAGDWLRALGPANRVTVVPGNHDRYLAGDWRAGPGRWLPYLLGDDQEDDEEEARRTADLEDLFPTLRIRPPVALIGCSTARPSGPHLATGTLGAAQLARLEDLLRRLAGQNLCRVLLLHHPPVAAAVSWRRGLTDAPALRALIARFGVELVLFGHAHRTLDATLPGPNGPVPVMGAPSVTARHGDDAHRSCWLRYTLRRTGTGWAIIQQERRYAADRDGYVDGPQRELAPRR